MHRLLTQLQKTLQPDLRTNNPQNCQKTELHGSLTTKDLKKPHSSRWIGGVETGGEAWRPWVAWRGGGMIGPTFMCGG